MILVAVLAAASLAGRSYWDRRLRDYNPILGSSLDVTVDDRPDLEPGQTVPVRVAYNFALRPGREPWPGAAITVNGSIDYSAA